MKPIPALSIRQPWAYAILHCGKDIENRDWATSYRGRVWLHASKSAHKAERDDWELLREQGFMLPPFKAMERGGIVGLAEIVDCVQDSESQWFNGPYGFVLRNPIITPMHPCKGMLGFFNVPADVQAALACHLERAA